MDISQYPPTREAAVTMRRRIIAAAVRFHARAFRIGTRWLYSKFDLGLRIALAQSFFISGMMALMHMHSFGLQPPLMHLEPLMSPLDRSQLGPLFEVIGATLLALGLFTQLSAFSLLLLVVAGANSLSGDSRLIACSLLLLCGIGGAGALSIDALFGGLTSSALTLAASVARVTGGARRYVLPMVDTLVRIWLGLSLLQWAHVVPTDIHVALPAPVSALEFPLFRWLSPVLGALLLTGLLTRYAAIALLLALAFGAMMNAGEATGFYWALILARVAFLGAGPISLDQMIENVLRRQYPEVDDKPAFALAGLPRVVILGAGFAGMSCAKALRHLPVAVTLVDRANHHVFQPLLYQVATASLSPGDIAVPIRSFFRDAFNVRVMYAEATGIDTATSVLQLDQLSIPYDFLVIATGATHGYFGKGEWAKSAPGLKRVEDATQIRQRLLSAFEKAELAEDPAEREALLTFLIVGGGPTGVELAGAIAELARLGMHNDFRAFDPREARIILVQSAGRVLPTFPESLSVVAHQSLVALGVEVLTGSRVDAIDESGVTVGSRQIPARTVLWAAGVVASPAGAWINAACDPAGRIFVSPDLTVPGHEDVFAVGDVAATRAWAGQSVPGLAPAAKQTGSYVARAIRAKVLGKPTPAPFEYRHWGSLATIGRKSAVADFGKVRLWGAPAWWLWGALHVGLLVGVRNRLSTLVNWFWSYVTFGGAIRLITRDDRS